MLQAIVKICYSDIIKYWERINSVIKLNAANSR